MTKYEVFLRRAGGYYHVTTVESPSARAAYNTVIERAEEAADDEVETSGIYLIVPTTNATVIDRKLVERYETTERTIFDVENPTPAQVEETPA